MEIDENELKKFGAKRFDYLKEEIMEIVTSWGEKAAQKTREEIALNLLKRGMVVQEIAQITGLTVEQVIQLQAQLTQEN